MSQDIVTGCVEHIIYQNEDNGYTVLELATEGDLVTVTGNLGRISEGETLKCAGRYTTHPVYGEQFKVESFEITEPGDLLSIERYLGSGAIKGIGPALAARIVGMFGEDTLRVVDEEPELLVKVRGISADGARSIAAQVAEKRELRQAMMYLQQYGISLSMSVRIYEKYGSEVYSVLQTNPYRLAEDIDGIGFKIADDIAQRTGFAPDSDFRIKSGIYYTLLSAIDFGHVYLPREILLRDAAANLGIPDMDLSDRLTELVIDKKIVIKERSGCEAVYAAPYYYMELSVARKLADLDIRYEVDEEEIDRILEGMASGGGLEADADQRKAVITAASGGVTVITGGPGTGKTTTINALISVFENSGLKIRLAAPTGRAAKRMTEATGRDACTIHRLLEFMGSPEGGRESAVRFSRNESEPLEEDVFIIDEMSMVDIFLMSSLVKAVPVGARLIMVGDADQLPSVGPGNVLRDLIESGRVPSVRLTHIFRQDEAGDIVLYAHRILDGEPVDPDRSSQDFIFVKREDYGRITGSTITLVKDKLPKYVHADPFDIQILTPMKKGALGVQRLNEVLQEALNPPSDGKREHLFPQGILREGDKVMQVRNNYQIEWTVRGRNGLPVDTGQGVFNGDIGRIRSMNLFSEELTVVFDEGREVVYPFRETGDLELAYALTVHKSQGSEYPAVVIPLLGGPRPLMTRNLIYTAVTRARKCVCIVGLPQTFLAMAANDEEQRRYSGLAQCIREVPEWE